MKIGSRKLRAKATKCCGKWIQNITCVSQEYNDVTYYHERNIIKIHFKGLLAFISEVILYCEERYQHIAELKNIIFWLKRDKNPFLTSSPG